ncbi:hypothetical protein [Robiginitalea sp. IMCC43444]|uniref:hypothetical protein n=1 Tax=Robiginitalea sp. IMCC43444 TaxID=3459121 RepID=UPI004042CCFE
MIKFFRRIRQNLLSAGKTGKYFKYAIGEIILVVIGILIALQINNWNEQRISNLYENKLLKELRSTIIADYNLLQMAIDGNNRTSRSCEIILNHFDQNLPYHDSLDLHFENANLWWTMVIRKNAYETAKAYGLDFIKNDSTRILLSGLYEQVQTFGQTMDERQSLFHYNTVTPVLIELFESIDKTWYLPERGNVPNDYEALKNNKTYRAILKTNMGNRQYYNRWIAMTLSQMKSLEKRLQLEIENR